MVSSHRQPGLWLSGKASVKRQGALSTRKNPGPSGGVQAAQKAGPVIRIDARIKARWVMARAFSRA